MVWLVSMCACTSVRPLEADLVARHTGFLHVGVTTAMEIEDRLGQQFSRYEEGRIRIYRVFFDDRERLTLKALPGGTCNALVLVFDDTGVLKRCGLVKYGCQEAAP